MMFRKSSETGKEFRAKVLVWGPPGSGKTHFGLSAPRPVLVDVENRGRSFASRADEFSFGHAEIGTIEDLQDAFKALRAGKVDCESIVTDSGTAIYLKFVEEHTKITERGSAVTDWVTVNRRFIACMNFAFAIAGINVVFTMHAATKLVRNGQDFRAEGLHFIGDDKFRFGFDYIFRIEPVGPPAEHRAIFHVEKSVSPHIPVGGRLDSLTWPKLAALARGEKSSTPAAPAAAQQRQPEAPKDDGTPISVEQCEKIEVYSQRVGWGQMRLADAVKSITKTTPLYKNMTSAQAARLIRALEQLAKDVA